MHFYLSALLFEYLPHNQVMVKFTVNTNFIILIFAFYSSKYCSNDLKVLHNADMSKIQVIQISNGLKMSIEI